MKRSAYEGYAKFVRKEAVKGNIKTILEIEQSILANDLTVATDQREVDSLKAGIQRMDAAISSLLNVRNYLNFTYYLKGCGLKNLDRNGLPLDGFRYGVAGQIVSLQNNTRDNKSQCIRDFIDVRTEALKYADKLYRIIQIKYMIEFCKESPEHVMCQKFLSVRSNQKYLKNINGKDRGMEL